MAACSLIFLFLLPFESHNILKLPFLTSMQQCYSTQQILISIIPIYERGFGNLISVEDYVFWDRLHSGSEYIQTQKFAQNLIVCKQLCTYSMHLKINRRLHTNLHFIFSGFLIAKSLLIMSRNKQMLFLKLTDVGQKPRGQGYTSSSYILLLQHRIRF